MSSHSSPYPQEVFLVQFSLYVHKGALRCCHVIDWRGHHSISRGAGVFGARKLFISTGLGRSLKISHFITCSYRTVLEVNYLFHSESAEIIYFKKTLAPPPPLEIEWCHPKLLCHWTSLECDTLSSKTGASCNERGFNRRNGKTMKVILYRHMIMSKYDHARL